MARPVKHLSLHRIAGTELRVMADVETGVTPLIQVEETVIRRYAQQEFWPHRSVTLFVLQDLQPLARQLGPAVSAQNLPAGGVAALPNRLIVNVYDLADLSACHVFVNWQAMVQEGYWDDIWAIEGLLAHEHAHPLVENETTRASRQLEVNLGIQPPAPANVGPADRQGKVEGVLTRLANKLCLYAPREIFTNQTAITAGFGSALLHLNWRNIATAGRSLAGRAALCQQLQQEVNQGGLSPTVADILLLIGDMEGHLDLALEIAPFYRAGQESNARQLETLLETALFPQLAPQVAQAYTALREQYLKLGANLTPAELMAWSEAVLHILVEVLAEKKLDLRYRVRPVAR